MLILKGHKEPVNWLAYTPDGSALVSLDRSDVVRVWDIPAGKLRWAVEDKFFTAIALTADGRHVFTYQREGTSPTDFNGRPRPDFEVQNPGVLRDIQTGNPTPVPLRYRPGQGPFRLLFAPDGSRCVAVLGSDSRDLNWWSLPSWEPLPNWPNVVSHPFANFRAMVFSRDGRTFAGMGRDGVAVHDAASGERRLAEKYPIVQDECRLAFHPDGMHLAVGSATRLSVFDLATGNEVGAIRQAKKYFLDAAFSPDGRFLATVSNEETVKFWDTTTWQVSTEYAWQVGGLRTVAFAPDGMTAAAAGMGKKIVVWDVDA